MLDERLDTSNLALPAQVVAVLALSSEITDVFFPAGVQECATDTVNFFRDCIVLLSRSYWELWVDWAILRGPLKEPQIHARPTGRPPDRSSPQPPSVTHDAGVMHPV